MWRSAFHSVKRSAGYTSQWKIATLSTLKHPQFTAPSSSVAPEGADTQELRVFIVAGEPSGDVIGSRLMASLRRVSPQSLRFAGVGGASMEKEGLESEFNIEDISVMGVAELSLHLFRIWARLRQTVAAALAFKPDVVVTVDAKGFSFRVLRSLVASYENKREEPPILVHYVAPSYWAWKGGDAKLKNLREFVNHVLCILPFEEAVCKAHGMQATFVGHPVLEDAFMNVASGDKNTNNNWEIKGNGPSFRDQQNLLSGATLISVLPGSRVQEVKRMLPLFKSAMHRLADKYPQLTAVIPTALSPLVTDMVEKSVKSWEVPVIVLPAASDLEKYDAFAASDAGLCTSGTAVLQLQMARVPSVVAYRANPVTEWLIKSRTKLEYISLPNILLNSPVIPEALFDECTPERLASLLKKVLDNQDIQELQRNAADQVLTMLAPPTSSLLRSHGTSLTIEDIHGQRPSMTAATTILQLLDQLSSTKRHPITY